jgi:hypothetical protein
MKKMLGKIRRSIASSPATLDRTEMVFSVVWHPDRPGLEAVLGQHSEEAASALSPQLAINGTSLPPSRRQRRPDDGCLILSWEELPFMANEQEKNSLLLRFPNCQTGFGPGGRSAPWRYGGGAGCGAL